MVTYVVQNRQYEATVGFNKFGVLFFCGYADDTIVRPTASLDRVPGTDPTPCSAYPTEISIPPWEMYIVYSTNPFMVGSIYDTVAFKPYCFNLY